MIKADVEAGSLRARPPPPDLGAMTRALVVPLVLLWAQVVCAQAPPREPVKVTVVDGALPSAPTAGLVASTLRISFEQTQLMDLGLATHNVVTHHSAAEGDEHSRSTWLCY